MKRKIATVVVLLCLVAAFVLPPVRAAGDIYFTAINNEVQPLNDATMPRYFGEALYIPYTFFSSEELGVFFYPGTEQVLLYSANKSLTFDIDKYMVTDQDGHQSYISALKTNGLIYVPVNDVCKFFGLTYTVISANPAKVVRFMKGSSNYNNPMFLGLNMSDMQAYYDAYVGTETVPVSPGVTPSSPVTPTGSKTPTYESVYIYLSFYDLTQKNFKTALDALNTYGYKSCFFVSADEIMTGDADLLRRAAGSGHTIGIWLKDGTFDEYQKASAALFEAAKVKTILVSANGDAAKTAEATASANGLVFWHPTRTYDGTSKISYAGITGKLTVMSGNRESINFACSDKLSAFLGDFLNYLAQNKYSVRIINIKTPPTKSV